VAEIPEEAVQAAAKAVMAKEWKPDAPWSVHNIHQYDSDCAVCREDVPAMLSVGLEAAIPHLAALFHYLSTGCFHQKCGSCRSTCKFCGEPCKHDCHPRAGDLPISPVTTARDVARTLWAALESGLDPADRDRIAALHWIAGEVPDGTHPLEQTTRTPDQPNTRTPDPNGADQ